MDPKTTLVLQLQIKPLKDEMFHMLTSNLHCLSGPLQSITYIIRPNYNCPLVSFTNSFLSFGKRICWDSFSFLYILVSEYRLKLESTRDGRESNNNLKATCQLYSSIYKTRGKKFLYILFIVPKMNNY